MCKKRGFSLVEAMVASVLFSLVLLGLISVFMSGGKHLTHVRERMTSAQLGKFFLDPLQIYVRQDTWDQVGNELMVGSRAGVAQSINNRNFSEIHAVDDATTDSALVGTNVRRVITTISWIEPSS